MPKYKYPTKKQHGMDIFQSRSKSNSEKYEERNLYAGFGQDSLRRIVLLFCLAMAIRLLFLFLVVPICFDWDSYHHWQISYYTLHIGLQNGRMWDLTGMEYFWGILPELVQAFLLWAFGTRELLPFRLFNAFIGSVSTVLIYLVVRRYRKEKEAITASVFCSVLVTIVAWNVSGVNETLGIMFLLLSLLLYEEKSYLCGVSLGLASMCRIEYWILSLGVLSCYLIFRRSSTDFIPSLLGWFTPMGPYFYFLWIWTGDFLYPLKLNYLASYYAWQKGEQPPLIVIPPESIPYKILWTAIFVASALLIFQIYRKERSRYIAPDNSVLEVLQKRRSGYIVPVFFLGFLMFQGATFVLSYRYLAGPWTLDWLVSPWSPGSLHDRPWMLNYVFVAILLAKAADKLDKFALKHLHIQKGTPRVELKTDHISRTGCVFVAVFLVWLLAMVPAYHELSVSSSGIKFWFGMADIVADGYDGGTVIAEGPPMIVYELAQRGIPPRKVLSSFYSPKYYGGDEKQTLDWFRNLNATWYIHDPGSMIFPELASSKDWGPFLLYRQYGSFTIYQVKFMT